MRDTLSTLLVPLTVSPDDVQPTILAFLKVVVGQATFSEVKAV